MSSVSRGSLLNPGAVWHNAHLSQAYNECWVIDWDVLQCSVMDERR